MLILENDPGGLFNFRREILQAFLDAGHEIRACLTNGPFADSFIHMECGFNPCEFNRQPQNRPVGRT